MRPISKKVGLGAAILCASLFWNCGTDSADNDNIVSTNVGSAKVALKLDYAQTPLIDSLVLDCFGSDTLHLVHEANDVYFSMDLFPSDHWLFKARIYANGELMQMGELETKLAAGTSANLNIQMHPIVGFVYIEVPLGLSNSAGINSGKMTLSSSEYSYTIPMVQTASSGVFKSQMLKLGLNYDVVISLLDENGKEIYKLTDKFLLTEDSPVPNLTLNSLRSQVALAVSVAPEKKVELTLPLPASCRKPKADELLISEVFAAPDFKDSTQYEFIEIYNGSLDSLLLDNCSIGSTNSSSIKHIPITATYIAPNQALVLGNPNSTGTPSNFINTSGWNDLGNSKGSVVLKCEGIALDSLYYAPEPDSLHPNVVPGIGSSRYGSSSQLKLERWQNRKDSTAWSLTTPTPGSI